MQAVRVGMVLVSVEMRGLLTWLRERRGGRLGGDADRDVLMGVIRSVGDQWEGPVPRGMRGDGRHVRVR